MSSSHGIHRQINLRGYRNKKCESSKRFINNTIEQSIQHKQLMLNCNFAFSTTDATTRNQESNWRRLTTYALMGNKKGDLSISRDSSIVQGGVVEIQVRSQTGFTGVRETNATPFHFVPFRYAHSDRALKKFKSCKLKQISFQYHLMRIN
jgi:hypothetical protein